MKTANPDFEYDTYGNLIVDNNKGITEISYNHLNLPKKIIFENDNTIEYLYDANGTKLKKIVTDNTTNPIAVTTINYIDGFQYNGNTMDFFPTAEGYVKATHTSGGGIGGGGITFNYVFNYTDHLGNIRLRYAINPVNQWLEILEEDHYYPFGLKHQGYNNEHEIFEFDENISTVVLNPVNPLTGDKYKYKFGGKELQSEFGIEMYDFGARNYDPALGRWMNIDPLANKYYNISPYVYVANMPVRAIDPDGKKIIIRMDGNPNSSDNVRKRLTIQKNLQKLTNQKIKLVKQGNSYIVKIDGNKKTNSDKNLTHGTELMDNLITSKKDITIELTDGANHIRKSKNGNSTIFFNSNYEGDTIANEDGSTGTPAEIGLAHELIHADENLDGETDKTPVKIINPDGTNPGEIVETDQDELNVRNRENIIRDEQDLPFRKTPEIVED